MKLSDTLKIVVLALVLNGCATAPNSKRVWEYKTVAGDVWTKQDLADSINKSISEGWEFVSFEAVQGSAGVAMMRRPLSGAGPTSSN